MPTEFDGVIIGAGQADPSLASRLTSTGMSVALIERKLVGGTCLNTGCRPTKTMVASARIASLARRAAAFGIKTEGVGIDMERVAAPTRKVIVTRGPATKAGSPR